MALPFQYDIACNLDLSWVLPWLNIEKTTRRASRKVRGRALAGGHSHFDSRVRGRDLIVRPKLDFRHKNLLFVFLQMEPVFDIFSNHGRRLCGKGTQKVGGWSSNSSLFSFWINFLLLFSRQSLWRLGYCALPQYVDDLLRINAVIKEIRLNFTSNVSTVEFQNQVFIRFTFCKSHLKSFVWVVFKLQMIFHSPLSFFSFLLCWKKDSCLR